MTTFSRSSSHPGSRLPLAPNPQLLSFLLLAAIALFIAAAFFRPAQQALPDPSNLSLAFVPNEGQSDPQVRFQTHGMGGALFFTQEEVVLSLPARQSEDTTPSAAPAVLRIHFEGAAEAPALNPTDKLPGVFNYMVGASSEDWHTNLPTYGALLYEALYPGIDMRYEGTDGSLKSTYYVAPGVDPSIIRWSYNGASAVALSESGAMQITMPDGRVLNEAAPIAWQEINGARIPVEVAYRPFEGGAGFAVGRYDSTRPLTIDPTLNYSTFLRGGATDTDVAADVAIANIGGVDTAFVTGQTFSSPFPSAGGPGSAIGVPGQPDLFVMRINPDVSGAGSLLYTTIIGGSGLESAFSITAEASGRVYVAGTTGSANFPAAAAQTLDTSFGGGGTDAFLIALNASGATLDFMTYLGGVGADSANGIAQNGTRLFATGTTNSPSGFPAPTNTGHPKRPGADAFVIAIDNPTTAPAARYFSFLGGDDAEEGYAIAVEPASGDAFITGYTRSFNVPIQLTDASTKTTGERDAFVARFDPDINGLPSLLYSTLLGGSSDDTGYGITVNAAGEAYVTGSTLSSNFPTTAGTFQPTEPGAGDGDAFVTRFSPGAGGTPTRLASTYLGGTGEDMGRDIALGPSGTLFVTGATASNGFGANSLQAYGGSDDAFVSKLSGNLVTRFYSTYLGGSGSDISYGIALDATSRVYIAGATNSIDYYTLPGAPANTGFETTGGGGTFGTDGFFARLTNNPPTVTNNGLTLPEGGTATITTAELNATDTDDVTAALIFTVGATVPANGTLQFDPDGPGGVAPTTLTTGSTFTQADIAAGRISYTHNGSETNSDSFSFTVSDGTDTVGPQTFLITITPVNDPPVVNDQTFTVAENSANGTSVGTVVATDPDGPALAYSITAGNTGTTFAINPTTGEITVADNTILDFETNPTFTLTVDVSDGTLNDTATITINLTNVNDPPVVNDQTFSVAENSPNGTAVGTVVASDQDVGAVLAYSITAGNTGSTFAIDPVTGAITVANNAVLDFETNPTFSLTVQVSDGTANDTATITINLTNVNEAPVVNDQTFGPLPENSANGTSVGTVVASDPDAATTLNYSITAGNTGGAFAINLTTGEITVANSAALDFETNPTFTLTVEVTDGTLTDTATITINLSNVNEAPVVNDQTFGPLPENSANGTAVGTVVASDPDAATALAYSITAGNTGGAFAINPTTGAITVASSAALDFEINPVFTLTVDVSDGTLNDTATITINLSNVNEAPVVNDQTFTVAENSANGTSVGTVVANDPDAATTLTYSITAGNTGTTFAINPATGEITVADNTLLDFETNPTFTLTVQVSDGTLNDTAAITINLTNVNEPPVMNDQTFTVAENAANGTVVGTVVATDPDGPALTYSITAGNTGGTFAINTTTGQITVLDNTVLDFETNPVFTLTVDVTDGTSNDTATITINLTNVNEAPVVNDQTFSVVENSPNGTAVGTVVASDPDAATALAYSITAGNTGGAFTINPTTGEITVAASAAVDFETNPTFTLTVQVSDGTLNDTATITINVTNVNDPPVVNDQTFTVAENSAVSTTVGTVVATDADGPALTYSITAGNTGNTFAINPATGEITVFDNTILNFETNPTFTLTVDVSDGTLNDTAAITINLTNVNEAPVVNDQTFSVAENSPNGTAVGTVLATDPDAATVLNYSITAGNTGGAFAINPTTGALTVANSTVVDFETNPTFTLTVQVSDGTLNDTATITINVTNANDPPVVTITAGTAAYTENAIPVQIDAAATVSDIDSADFDTGSLTVSVTTGADAGDVLQINNQGTGPGQIGIAAGTVSFGGVQFGTFTGGTAGTPLLVTFDADATPAVVEALIRQILYSSTSDAFAAASTTNKTVQFVVSDGDTAPNSSTTTRGVVVTGVNDAPVLDNTGTMILAAVPENSTGASNTGTLVSVIIGSAGGDRITDPDTGALEGIAVVATDTTNGAWEFSTNGGTTWVDFGTVNATSAVLLAADANTRIRFIPDPNFNGLVDPGITFHAWDTTTGVNGLMGADPTPGGGTTAFSTATETASISVTSVNQAPVLDNSGTMSLTAIDEDVADASNTGDLVSAIISSAGGDRITDADTGAVEGIAVVSADTTNGTWEFSIDGGTSWTSLGTPSGSAAVLLASDANTRIRFVPNLDFNGTVDPGITFRAWDVTSGANGATGVDTSTNGDPTAFSTATETASITVNPVNDNPTAVDDTAAVERDSTDNPIDVLANDSIAPDTGETLTITAVGAAANGTVTIVGGGTGVTYTPDPGYNGLDSFTYTISDGNGGTATATVNLRVGGYMAFLPLVIGQPTPADLTVSNFTVTPGGNSFGAGQDVQINVTVTNNGQTAAGGFWVDFYINPTTPPTASNIPWESVCGLNPCYGIAWYVSGGLAPGQSITLTSTPDSYYAANTRWEGFFARGTTDLYVYVDSWNPTVANGAVNESDETNNRAERRGLSVTGTTPAPSSAPQTIKPRPVHPSGDAWRRNERNLW